MKFRDTSGTAIQEFGVSGSDGGRVHELAPHLGAKLRQHLGHPGHQLPGARLGRLRAPPFKPHRLDQHRPDLLGADHAVAPQAKPQRVDGRPAGGRDERLVHVHQHVLDDRHGSRVPAPRRNQLNRAPLPVRDPARPCISEAMAASTAE